MLIQLIFRDAWLRASIRILFFDTVQGMTVALFDQYKLIVSCWNKDFWTYSYFLYFYRRILEWRFFSDFSSMDMKRKRVDRIVTVQCLIWMDLHPHSTLPLETIVMRHGSQGRMGLPSHHAPECPLQLESSSVMAAWVILLFIKCHL